MQHSTDSKRGFTLIEILVVISIIMMLLSLGAISLSSFTASQQMRMAIRKVHNSIGLTRQLAVSYRKPMIIEFRSKLPAGDYFKYADVGVEADEMVISKMTWVPNDIDLGGGNTLALDELDTVSESRVIKLPGKIRFLASPTTPIADPLNIRNRVGYTLTKDDKLGDYEQLGATSSTPSKIVTDPWAGLDAWSYYSTSPAIHAGGAGPTTVNLPRTRCYIIFNPDGSAVFGRMLVQFDITKVLTNGAVVTKLDPTDSQSTVNLYARTDRAGEYTSVAIFDCTAQDESLGLITVFSANGMVRSSIPMKLNNAE